MKPPATLFNDPSWLRAPSSGDDIELGTVGRLMRNVCGLPFPGWSTRESRAALVEQVMPFVASLSEFEQAWHADMNQLSFESRRALLARKLITPCMAARGEGCHVLIPRGRHLSLMLNEEEHMALHCFFNGSASVAALETMRRYAAEMAQHLPLARDPAFGFLTSLPGEAGDGMQLYRILHLPALTMAGMMPQVMRAIEALHLNISPYYSDGQDDTGNTYVVYSVPGPLGSADELTAYFDAAMEHLVHRERQVRLRLQENDALRLMDAIFRAYGLMLYAYRMTLKELRDAVSVLRLATACGIMVWDKGKGAASGIAKMRALLRRAAVEAALAEPEKEEELFCKRASEAGSLLRKNSHHFQPLKLSKYE